MENQGTTPVQTMEIKDWLITFLITAIPLVGIIMLFVWAFGNDTNGVKTTWAKASLIWIAIVFIISMVFYFTIFAAIIGSGVLNNM